MKYVTLLVFPLILFIACSESDKLENLKELEARRDALTRKIEQLKTEMNATQAVEDLNNLDHVTLQKVTPKEFRHYIKIQGMIDSDQNIFIPAEYSGVVKKIHVVEGDDVRQGQLLAELDAAILENTLSEVEVNLELAQTVYERQQRLWDKNIGSEIQYLQAKTNVEALRKRKASVEEQLALTRIKAPIKGTIDKIAIREGEAVAAGFGTIRIVENAELKITADLSEQYTGRVKVGDPVNVHIPVTDDRFTAKILSVARVIDPSNRTFGLEIEIPSNRTGLQPNMLAVLEINDYRNSQALVIPINTIQKSADRPFLFIAVSDTISDQVWRIAKRTVDTGMVSEDEIEILNGLSNGDYIVIEGYQDLADGQIVYAEEGTVY